ncbi:MAG TPA: phosphoribosyltransferase family protein [Mycobacteriales bacterium]|nr:phosphoribosyltransferase family protein [Mycobacteriales bacterium]
MRFGDREDAGRQLGVRLSELKLVDPVVLGLPRGGVPVAAAVAAGLSATFDVFVARKVGAPDHEELGIGAVAEGDHDVVVSEAAPQLGIGQAQLEALADRARAELDRRVRTYRGDRKLPELAGRDVAVVDDGLATGVTAEAALRALRARRPRRLVLAVPVAAPESVRRLAAVADDVVCLAAPAHFYAVGQWYDAFPQLTDAAVLELLGTARLE